MEHVCLNGKIVPIDQAVLPVTDPAFAHGFGLFEVLRAYRGMPFRTGDHVTRMKRSARHFGIKCPWQARWIDGQIRELCRRNRLPDAAVRMVVTGGGAFLIRIRALDPLPRAWYEKGARVVLAGWKRDPEGPLQGHKTLNYLENIRARERARELGAADAIYVGLRNEILEGSATNVFLVKKGRLVTPAVHGVLPGVTRRVILEIVRAEERTVYAGELYKADEIFLTNALIEVLPVTHLGTRRVCGVGPMSRRLADEYSHRARDGV